MNRIFVTGMAGSGKSTVAQQIKKQGFMAIDVDEVDDLCNWVNLESGKKLEKYNTANVNDEFMEAYDYRCDMDLLKRMMGDSNEPIFVFGCVGNNSSFLPLFDKVLLLQCTPEMMIERLNSRDTNVFGKDTEVQKRILDWKKTFDQLMIEAGANVINTDQPLEAVVNKVLDYV